MYKSTEHFNQNIACNVEVMQIQPIKKGKIKQNKTTVDIVQIDMG